MRIENAGRDAKHDDDGRSRIISGKRKKEKRRDLNNHLFHPFIPFFMMYIKINNYIITLIPFEISNHT